MTSEISSITTRDGRALEVLTGGAPDGVPLVFHGGQPSAAVPYEPFDSACREAGLRLVTYSRPGYGASSARPRQQPRIADDVDDVEDLLATLGIDTFLTAGWSGGGPRALACAALLPGRCLAALSIAGTAPHDGDGLVWSVGMAPENIAEYTAAHEGRAAYAAYLEREFLPVMLTDADEFAEAMGGLVPDVDRAALDRPFLEWLTATFHHAAAQRIAGMCDDGLALVAPWGFDVASLRVPALILQGTLDAMVPLDHGRWLIDHVPTARGVLLEEHGHLSIIGLLPQLLEDLRAAALQRPPDHTA